MIDRNKSLLTISGKVAVGVARDTRKFSGHPYIYRAHGAVIFAIGWLSCYIIPACDGRTDRQTDGRNLEFIIADTALCIASYADAL